MSCNVHIIIYNPCHVLVYFSKIRNRNILHITSHHHHYQKVIIKQVYKKIEKITYTPGNLVNYLAWFHDFMIFSWFLPWFFNNFSWFWIFLFSCYQSPKRNKNCHFKILELLKTYNKSTYWENLKVWDFRSNGQYNLSTTGGKYLDRIKRYL